MFQHCRGFRNAITLMAMASEMQVLYLTWKDARSHALSEWLVISGSILYDKNTGILIFHGLTPFKVLKYRSSLW